MAETQSSFVRESPGRVGKKHALRDAALPNPRERIMVCVDADELALRLVRSAHELASRLRAEWIVVHVQTPLELRRAPHARQTLEQALAFAGEHGAQVVILPGQVIVAELMQYARSQQITRIFVGKHFWERWRIWKRSVSDALIRSSGEIHVIVVAADTREARTRALLTEIQIHPLRGYLSSLLALVGATIFGLIVRPYIAPTNIALVYLLAVVLSATIWGLGPAILSSILAVLAFDVLFVPPYGRLEVHDPQYFLTFIIFLIIGILISELGARLRAEVQESRQREQETSAMYALSQSMSRANDTNASLDTALHQIALLFDADAVLLRSTTDGKLETYPPTELDAEELRAAQWAFDHKEGAGIGTGMFADTARSYLPLLTAQGTFGVLCLQFHGAEQKPLAQQRLLEMLVGQVAFALEHAKLSEQAEQARLLEASERFRNALLSSLSHDLRTPLASILGSATSLLDQDAQLDLDTRRDLGETIREEATRLNRYVGNLLNMTRLESGMLQPQRDWHSVEEVIGSALARFETNGQRVQLHLAPNLPLVSFDFILIEQVLINLLDNAYKFSSATGPIEISARAQDDWLVVSVADQGRTIPTPELERVFEKFHRVPNVQSTFGMGLGLSIAKGIVEAHGGTIAAKQRVLGTEIEFRLPLQKMEPIVE